MAVALDGQVRINPDGAGGGNATQVVSCQVHQHDVLGNLFGVLEQTLFQYQVLFGVTPAWTGAGNGSQCGHAILQFHHGLRRGTGNRAFANFDKIHVRRRVDQAQGAVSRERIKVTFPGKPVCQHDLKDITIAYFCLGLVDQLHIFLPGKTCTCC